MADTNDRISASASSGPLLSIVMPVHNEQECLPQTYARTTAVCRTLRERVLDYELIFVNDGSTDGSMKMLDRYAHEDPHVRAVHLTRNFGHQPAVSAGLALARGDVIAVMDADLQDPPEVFPQFLDQWEAGYQVVYAIRQARKEWFGKRLAYWSFYRLLNAVSDIKMPLDSGDFCVMDRSALDLLNALPERQRFVRGLRTWIGLKQIGVRYERSMREAGTPSYHFSSLLKLAMDGLVSFSSSPLRLSTRLAAVSIFSAVLLGAWIVLAALVLNRTPPGWASLACLILLVSSIQLFSLGVIGEYLSRIFLEVKGRPTYLIARIEQQEDRGSISKPAADRTMELAISRETCPEEV